MSLNHENSKEKFNDLSVSGTTSSGSEGSRIMARGNEHEIDVDRHLFPHCIVWTPIPCLTWLFPFIGHLGIATSSGIIRDFAGPYYVSENNMGFGWPTRYVQMDLNRVVGGASAWDRAVQEASDEYKGHNHNLFCDNCHSHVALALNLMTYNGKSSYNMFILAAWVTFKGRFVRCSGFLLTCIPFMAILAVILVVLVLKYSI